MKFKLLLFLLLLLPANKLKADTPKECNICSCEYLPGQKLLQCMKELGDVEYKKHLTRITHRKFQRKLYFENLLKSTKDYQQFFDKFTEEEWENFWSTLNENEKQFFPQHKLELSAFLKRKRWAPIIKKIEHIKSLILDNKYPLMIASSLTLIYIYYRFKLSNQVNALNKKITWSRFKKNVPIDILHEIPEDKVLQELTDAIYRTYAEDENNPDYNDIEPLYLFLKAAQKEIKRLESFVNLYWYLKLPGISLLFPNYDDESLLAEEKIERLHYMHNLISEKLIAMNS